MVFSLDGAISEGSGGALVTKATASDYDANPNLGGAPAVLQTAPIGTWFLEETAGLWWRRETAPATGWTDQTGGAAAVPSQIIRTYAAGVVLTDAVYQKSDGKADRTNANALATSETFLGFVAAIDTPSSGQATIKFHGDLAVFSGLVTGEVYILSTAPGQIVRLSDTGNIDYPDTTPGSGHVIRGVGTAVSATTLFIESSREAYGPQ